TPPAAAGPRRCLGPGAGWWAPPPRAPARRGGSRHGWGGPGPRGRPGPGGPHAAAGTGRTSVAPGTKAGGRGAAPGRNASVASGLEWRSAAAGPVQPRETAADRKSTRLNSSHVKISYAVFCLKKKNKIKKQHNR